MAKTIFTKVTKLRPCPLIKVRQVHEFRDVSEFMDVPEFKGLPNLTWKHFKTEQRNIFFFDTEKTCCGG